jgi:hexulose-6-phosphate isomerase
MHEYHGLRRRDVLASAGGVLLAGALGCSRAGRRSTDRPDEGVPHTVRLKKAVKYGMVQGELPIRDKFKLLRDLGFDGVELASPNDLDADEVLAARDASGLCIHGVVNALHWKSPLSHPDPEVRALCVESLRTSLRDARAYGATSVLVVPAVVNKEIAYDDAYRRSQAELRRLIPLAEELRIHLLIENVWNNFLLSPLEAARFIDELDSPMVGSYFDVGNVVRMGWPEQWIRILGPRIGKLDIKEYSRKKRDQEGLWKGFQVELGEGDCDWPAVMAALKDIRYSGWATAEIPGGDRERLADISRRMDRIFQT